MNCFTALDNLIEILYDRGLAVAPDVRRAMAQGLLALRRAEHSKNVGEAKERTAKFTYSVVRAELQKPNPRGTFYKVTLSCGHVIFSRGLHTTVKCWSCKYPKEPTRAEAV